MHGRSTPAPTQRGWAADHAGEHASCRAARRGSRTMWCSMRIESPRSSTTRVDVSCDGHTCRPGRHCPGRKRSPRLSALVRQSSVAATVVQRSAQCSAAQRSAVQRNAVQCRAAQCRAAQCSAMPCSEVQRSAVRAHRLQRRLVPRKSGRKQRRRQTERMVRSHGRASA